MIVCLRPRYNVGCTQPPAGDVPHIGLTRSYLNTTYMFPKLIHVLLVFSSTICDRTYTLSILQVYIRIRNYDWPIARIDRYKILKNSYRSNVQYLQQTVQQVQLQTVKLAVSSLAPEQEFQIMFSPFSPLFLHFSMLSVTVPTCVR